MTKKTQKEFLEYFNTNLDDENVILIVNSTLFKLIKKRTYKLTVEVVKYQRGWSHTTKSMRRIYKNVDEMIIKHFVDSYR